jgi:long-chain acyl-CoA synthetase
VDAIAAFGFGEALDENADEYRTRPALVCGSFRITWPVLQARVAQLAGAMEAEGVGAGDRVVWAGQNCHRLLEALLAAERIGAIFCPLNWRQSGDELRFVLDDAHPTVVLWQQTEIGDALQAARQQAASGGRWIAHEDEYEPWLAAAEPVTEAPPADPTRPLLMLYTAAFDGRPAASLLPARSLLLQALYGQLFGGVSSEDVYLNAGPLFHVGTFKATLATLVAGGTNVFVARAEAGELCRLIDAERCTGAFLQPPTMAAIVEANRDRTFDLSSLRAKPGPPGWVEMVTVESPRYRSGYGQTELGGVVTFLDADRPGAGSAGRPGPLTRVEIVDPDGRAAPAGDVGEIVVRGPAVHCGYHSRPDLTAERRRHGWHHTGDLGLREADGSISFVGPMSRLIKSAAENIYPAEVEACLRTHHSVADVAVIGVPDPDWGQSVRAIVVADNHERPTLEELQAHCRAQIASYKKPRSVVFTEALPRNGAIVDRDVLDAQFGGGGYPGRRVSA